MMDMLNRAAENLQNEGWDEEAAAVREAADEIERLRLREETLSGIIDGMTARFIEAQKAVEEIERLRDELKFAEQFLFVAEKEIERLREAAKDRPKDRPNDAADEIDRLRGIVNDDRLEGAADEIERLREELEDMHRRERSTAIQQLGNEGQWCDLVAAKDDEIERLRYALMKVCNSLDDNLPAITTKNIALSALGLPLRGLKEDER
jgi:DNA repair ATPase RecN